MQDGVFRNAITSKGNTRRPVGAAPGIQCNPIITPWSDGIIKHHDSNLPTDNFEVPPKEMLEKLGL